MIGVQLVQAHVAQSVEFTVGAPHFIMPGTVCCYNVLQLLRDLGATLARVTVQVALDPNKLA
eukprot:366145-Chlamydomonas_euryale.AAC.8